MILDTCQRLLNERIARSTAAKDRLTALEGKRFAIEITGLEMRIVIAAVADGVRIEDGGEAGSGEAVDATLKASPMTLVTLARSSSLNQLKQTTASLDGKLHVAESFAELFQFAKPELEAELADWIGDIAAHQVGAVTRKLFDFSANAARALEQNAAEYLQEEDPMLAHPRRVAAFVNDVDRLRDDVDRAEHRVDLLARATTARS